MNSSGNSIFVYADSRASIFCLCDYLHCVIIRCSTHSSADIQIHPLQCLEVLPNNVIIWVPVCTVAGRAQHLLTHTLWHSAQIIVSTQIQIFWQWKNIASAAYSASVYTGLHSSYRRHHLILDLPSLRWLQAHNVLQLMKTHANTQNANKLTLKCNMERSQWKWSVHTSLSVFIF